MATISARPLPLPGDSLCHAADGGGERHLTRSPGPEGERGLRI